LKKDKNIVTNPGQEKIAGNIVLKWRQMQEAWAAYMQRGLEHFSPTGKKYVVICFSVFSGGFCLYLIAASVMGIGNKYSIVTPIKKPQHILKSGEPARVFNQEAEYNKIEKLKKYRDSIYKLKKNK